MITESLELLQGLAYVGAAILFIFGLKLMNSPATAVKGNLLSACGMGLAIAVTLLASGIDWKWILIGVAIGSVIGAYAALKIEMTQMPEMVALFNGSGGLASLLLGMAEFVGSHGRVERFTAFVMVLAILIGGITFVGSVVAWGKLSGKLPGKPILFPFQQAINMVLLLAVLLAGLGFTMNNWSESAKAMDYQAASEAYEEARELAADTTIDPEEALARLEEAVKSDENIEAAAKQVVEARRQSAMNTLHQRVHDADVILSKSLALDSRFLAIVILSLVLGVLVVIPIGGADMPVAISLLNSYSGLAACAAGYVISNSILIVAGSLVGAAGLILTNIMCKAMNRSLANVLFSGFGSAGGTVAAGEKREAKSMQAADAYYVLEAASSVVIIPGYGLAVAQAQHAVRELGDLLEQNGAEVKYAIHPVAGRMPGHMNVLLAEANVPYEQLVEMDDINPHMENMDVAIVIGANDVVNPLSRVEGSPIYKMPIIEADKARNVFILKRSMASGFAGIENPLFFNDNSTMIFGDARKTIETIVEEFKN
jgi:NAD/NADP transhydrogenase beta subunit